MRLLRISGLGAGWDFWWGFLVDGGFWGLFFCGYGLWSRGNVSRILCIS